MKKEELVKNGLDTISQLSNQLSEHKDLASKYLDIYRMNTQCAMEIRKLELQNEVMIKGMTERYQLVRSVLSSIFAERQTALTAHYSTLDQALKNNDKELIIASLRGISTIVENNPLESFEKFTKVLDNKDETLYLDF